MSDSICDATWLPNEELKAHVCERCGLSVSWADIARVGKLKAMWPMVATCNANKAIEATYKQFSKVGNVISL